MTTLYRIFGVVVGLAIAAAALFNLAMMGSLRSRPLDLGDYGGTAVIIATGGLAVWLAFRGAAAADRRDHEAWRARRRAEA